MKTIYFENGAPVEGTLPASEWDIHGGGVFETLRIYNGRIFCEKEHLDRLTESARITGLSPLPNLADIRRQICSAVRAYGSKEAVVRVTLAAGKVLVMVGARKIRPQLYQQGIALATSAVRRSWVNASPPAAKSTDYMNAIMATIEMSAAPAGRVSECVFLDAGGYVTEVRIGNLFIVEKGGRKPRLKTPPLAGILDGVTRRLVIECALSQGWPVLETPLTRHEIYNAAEVFLTNTSWEVLPVCELDGRKIGEELPGQVTQQLHKLFKKRVQRECRRLKSNGR